MLRIKKSKLKGNWRGPVAGGGSPLAGVAERLVKYLGQDPEWVADLWAVTRRPSRQAAVMEFRIYDPSETGAMGLRITEYSSFDRRPGSVLFDGWLNPVTGETRLFDVKSLAKRAV